MGTVRFFLLDATYKVENGKAVVYLFGRTPEGERVCIRDATNEPYFYVVPDAGRSVQLEGVNVEGAMIVRTEKVRKNLNEKATDVVKVIVDLPSSVPRLREHVKGLPNVKQVLEADILFVRRYLIDRQLTPFMLCEAQCDPTTSESRVSVFDASNVKQASDETLTRPKVLAIDIEVYNPLGKRILPQEHPIVMLSLYGEGLRKVITWKRIAGDDIEVVDGEAAMLERAKFLIEQHQPDILAGYFSDGFDLPYIKERCAKYKIKLDMSWDFSEMRMGSGSQQECYFSGLVHLDVLRFVRTVMARSMKTDTFTLDAVAHELLGENKVDVDIESLARHWDNDAPELADFAKYNLHDTKLTHDLLLLILPNIIEMVKLVGLLPVDVTRMTFSQLVEWYIMRQAVPANELIPNRPGKDEQDKREMKRFKGAFVYEPTPGLYKDMVVFDYRSLYPSIIASHNISPGTLNCSCCEGKDVVPETQMWYCTRKRGFLSRIIEDVIQHRARVKVLLKQKKDPLLAARSEGLKVLANSFYGYLGFAPARWYCFECGQAVTAWGRYHIHDVITKAKEAGFVVVYSDTDSVFLQLGGKKKEDALAFLETVNRALPGMMEMDFEGYYAAGLFVASKGSDTGAKKRYALIDEKGTMKIRGFEVVRRNVSPIAKRTQEDVLKIILGTGDFKKAQAHVSDVVAKLRANEVRIEDVTISTALTKNISQYESKGPHVAAAQRMKDKGAIVGGGTRVTYVIIKGKGLIRDKVRLPEEIKQTEYDGDYYVNNQVLPAVDKIFEVVGVDIDSATTKKSQATLGSF